MDIRRLGPGDEQALEHAGPLFDESVKRAAATRFLLSEGHHILIAYEGETAIGFVTGVEMTHPDKGTEMFLYELGVHEDFQRRGYGKALVGALFALARERECYGMWVLTERENAAALATYRGADATEEETSILLSWAFKGTDDAAAESSGDTG